MRLIFSLITIINLSCSSAHPSDSVELKLSDNVNFDKGKNVVTLSFSISNSIPRNLLLYSFHNYVDQAVFEEEFYCKNRITANLALFIYNEKSEQQFAGAYIPDSLNYKPMPHEKLQNSLVLIKEKFRKSQQILLTNQTAEFVKQVDIKDFELEPGTYYARLLYYQGDNIVNMVTPEQIEEDQIKSHADVFKGCLWSNKVKLVIE